MTTTAMPQPAVWRVRYHDEPNMIGHYPWSYAESMPKFGFNPLYETETLITTEQAEGYAAARVREALEETADNVLASDPLATRRGLAAAIRASIPEQPAPKTQKRT